MTDADERRLRREARERAEARRNAECAKELLARTEMVTYRPADGSYVGDEYAHVGELDWWDDSDEPVVVVGERWALVERWEVEVPETAVELRDQLEAEAAAEDGPYRSELKAWAKATGKSENIA